MTLVEARMLLAAGRAAPAATAAHGWQIAHWIEGEWEWFSVNEADAGLLETAQRLADA
jgi:hypothetical protein